MNGLWQVCFWLCALVLLYVGAGYPAWMALRSRLHARPVHRGPVLPTFTVLMAVHNEAAVLGQRLRNLMELDYPAHRLDILVGSDGSRDGSVAAALGAGGRVRIVDFDRRRGKPSVLNDLVRLARGEILLFCDARQRFAPDLVRVLAADFGDPGVGAVGGRLVLAGLGRPSRAGIGCYWRYESFIRHRESLVDSTVGASGAVYAVRRHLFRPVPPDTILDDVVVPMTVVRAGYRVIHEPRALAYDQVSGRAGDELARKVRTIAGTFQLFHRQRWLLNPRQNRLWLQTVSHKGLRLLMPLLAAGMLVSSLALVTAPWYAVAAAVQLLFYGAGAGAALLPARIASLPPFSIPHAVCLLNGATVAGFVRWLRGAQPVTWARHHDRAGPLETSRVSRP